MLKGKYRKVWKSNFSRNYQFSYREEFFEIFNCFGSVSFTGEIKAGIFTKLGTTHNLEVQM